MFLSQNLRPRQTGVTDQLLDLPGFTGEIQLFTTLAFSYLINFPAQCHALFRLCGTVNEVQLNGFICGPPVSYACLSVMEENT